MTTTFVVDASGKSTIEKDPQAVLDYTFDWSAWLADIADTIANKTITVPVGLTLNSSAITAGNTKVVVWLAGGTLTQKYAVTCEIVTAGGRTDDRTFYVKIKDK